MTGRQTFSRILFDLDRTLLCCALSTGHVVPRFALPRTVDVREVTP
jgi:hypothetical protein